MSEKPTPAQNIPNPPENSEERDEKTKGRPKLAGTGATETSQVNSTAVSLPLLAALAYSARGWQVFPVHSIRASTDGVSTCSCGKAGCEHPGKHPRTAHGLKDATNQPEQIRAWWLKWPDANVGVRTGAESGIFVLDIDIKHDGAATLARLVAEHGPLPETVEAKSGGGGTHHYFKHPGKPLKTRANCEPGIDIRADGGYIVADPSNHISGGTYQWAESRAPEDVPLAVAPRWVLDLPYRKPPKPAASAAKVKGSEAPASTTAIREGSRHQRFTSLAGSMRQSGSSIDAIKAALEAENARCVDAQGNPLPLPEPEIEAILKAAEGWEEGESERPAQKDLVVRLALDRYRFGRTKTSEVFAVSKTGPMIARTLRGSADALRGELARCFYETHGKVPSSTSLADAMKVLEGMALNVDPEETYIRVGPYQGGVVLDLGDSTGRAVVITAAGWSVVGTSPILFRRTELIGPMPEPKHKPGIDGIKAFRSLLNVSEETWPSVLVYIVGAFFPTIEHPVLMLGGEQSTGKSTAAEMIGGLIDPSPCPLATPPRDVENWAIMAAAGWVRTLDNISHIPDWLSDALCRAVTGDAMCRRTLYTDGGVSVVEFLRVVVLTSIDMGVLRGDLGSRCLLVELERITKRRPKSELLSEYADLRPAIVAALLDLVVGVLCRWDSIQIDDGPRLLDFAKVCKAVDEILGIGAFDAYCDQAGHIAEDVVEGDPVAQAIANLVENCPCGWIGTATLLLERLSPDGKTPKDWPTSGKALSGRLKRATPALKAIGIEVERFKGKGRSRERQILLYKAGTEPTVRTVHPSKTGHDEGGRGDLARTVAPDDYAPPTNNRPPEHPGPGPSEGAGGRSDDADDPNPNVSPDDFEGPLG